MFLQAVKVLEGKELLCVHAEASESERILRDFDIKGFPSLNLYTSGHMVEYTGPRDSQAIVDWVDRKLWRDLTVDCPQLSQLIQEKDLILLLVAPNSLLSEARQAAKYTEDAEVFICPPQDIETVWREGAKLTSASAALIRRRGEEIIPFQGDFSAENIRSFLQKREFPAVIPLAEHYLSRLFSQGGNFLLFLREDKDKAVDIDISRIETKGDISVLYSDCSSDLGKQLCRLLKLLSEPLPLVRLVEARGGSRNITQFALKERPSRKSISAFLQAWREGKLPKLRAEQEPPSVQYDGDVKILVASTYFPFVSTPETTAVVLLYAPWW